MRVRPVNALVIGVTFTGMLAMIALAAITAYTLPQAIVAAAATEVGSLESDGSSVISLRGRDGRIADGDRPASSLRGRP